MKKAQMNISPSRFILFKLKICGEIATTKLKTLRQAKQFNINREIVSGLPTNSELYQYRPMQY